MVRIVARSCGRAWYEEERSDSEALGVSAEARPCVRVVLGLESRSGACKDSFKATGIREEWLIISTSSGFPCKDEVGCPSGGFADGQALDVQYSTRETGGAMHTGGTYGRYYGINDYNCTCTDVVNARGLGLGM